MAASALPTEAAASRASSPTTKPCPQLTKGQKQQEPALGQGSVGDAGFHPEQKHEQGSLYQPGITEAGFAIANFSISPPVFARITSADAKRKRAFTYWATTLCACTNLPLTQEVSTYAARPNK